MAGHGGGAWKVAYADFVTAMMAFFLVMWILAQSKEVKQAVAQYFKEPAMPWSGPSGSGLPSTKRGESPEVRLPKKGLRTRGRGPGDAELKLSPSEDPEAAVASKPSLSVLHDGDRRLLGGVVLFAGDAAELSEQGKERLKTLVPMLLGKRNKIEIRGHARRGPLRPGSPFQDPWQLCYARCLSTMKYLEHEGVDPERIRLSQAGTFEPSTTRAEPEKQAQNSRVEVYVLPELAEDLVGTREERAERFKSP